MELSYLTKGKSTPQGKEKVYFACHPSDFDLYFSVITEDIFKSQNCAVYYNKNSNDAWTEEDMELEFSKMQLVVIPITSNFLFEPSRAKDVEFEYAKKKHIPILPIMMEEGLDGYFAEICGELQFLNRTDTDVTAIPFEEKMEKFLSSVLIGEELADKVRAAFDAYIFLSYRKKDRRYAKELMKLIHKNDFARDIAIWYDEYLTPGEDFNEAIFDAIKKSELFAMVVTPNLINEENYVKNVEYPEAVREGKKILPAEMVITDKNMLEEKFSNIPCLIDAHSPKGLSDALVEHFKGVAIAENDDEPQHLFFIGLAYLGGIDVEIDYERALSLIEKAAEGGLLEAVEKLVAMYKNGDGVARDYNKSIKWQERLCELCRENYNKSAKRSTLDRLLIALWELGGCYKNIEMLPRARAVFDEMRSLAEQNLQLGDFKSHLSAAYEKLGDTVLAMGDTEKAPEYYEQSLKLREELAVNQKEMRHYNVVVSLMKLGIFYKSEGYNSKALELCNKASKIAEELVREDGRVEFRTLLAKCYTEIGDIAFKFENYAKAKEFYTSALNGRYAIAEETETAEAKLDLMISYSKIGMLAIKLKNPEIAREYFEKRLKIAEELAELKKGIIFYESGLLFACSELRNVHSQLGNFATAREYAQKEVKISKELAEKTGSIDSQLHLSNAYIGLGAIAFQEKSIAKSKEYYKKALETVEALSDNTAIRKIDTRFAYIYNALGIVAESEEDFQTARAYYEKELEVFKRLFEKTQTHDIYRDMSNCSYRLGAVLEKLQDTDRSRELFEKALEMRQRLADKFKTAIYYDKYAVSLYKVGIINNDIDMLKKAYNIYKMITDKLPDDEQYSKKFRRTAARLKFMMDNQENNN